MNFGLMTVTNLSSLYKRVEFGTEMHYKRNFTLHMKKF